MSYVAPLTLRFNPGSKGARAESAVTATAKPALCYQVLWPWMLAAPVVRGVCARPRAVLVPAEWRSWASLPCHHPPHPFAGQGPRSALPTPTPAVAQALATAPRSGARLSLSRPVALLSGPLDGLAFSPRAGLSLPPGPSRGLLPRPRSAPLAPLSPPPAFKLPTPAATKLPAPDVTMLPSSPCMAPRWFRAYGAALWAQYRGAGLPPPAAAAAAPPASLSFFFRQGVGAALPKVKLS